MWCRILGIFDGRAWSLNDSRPRVAYHAVQQPMEAMMTLIVHRIDFYNDSTDGETYRLVVKDGDKVVGHTNAVLPTGHDALSSERISLERPLTLIAEKV